VDLQAKTHVLVSTFRMCLFVPSLSWQNDRIFQNKLAGFRTVARQRSFVQRAISFPKLIT
jgi:hypothetical protein